MKVKVKIKKDELRKKLDIKDGITPIKGKDYFDGKDGKDADEKKIVQKVLVKVPKPKDGKDGKDGKNGIAIDGKDGIDGIDGIGIDGKDGSPDTPPEIRNKLSSLKEGKRLSYDVLDNTPEIPNLTNIEAIFKDRYSSGLNEGQVRTLVGPLISSAVAVENLWDRVGTTLVTHNAGDNVDIGDDTPNDVSLRVFANDDGAGTTGIFVPDVTLTRGTWISPSGQDGVTFDAAGAIGAMNKRLWFQYYSSGNLDLCHGGGDVIANYKLGVGVTPTHTLDVRAASSIVNIQSITGTNAAWLRWRNTGGNVIAGQESSAGGAIFADTLPYAGIFGHGGAYPLQFGTGGVIRLTISDTGDVYMGTALLNAGVFSMIQGVVAGDPTFTITQAGDDVTINQTVGDMTIAAAGGDIFFGDDDLTVKADQRVYLDG